MHGSRLTLDARRSPFGQGSHLFEAGHGGVPGERRDQRAVSPAQLHRLFRRLALHYPVEEPGGEPISTTDTIKNIQLSRGSIEALAVDPGHCTPTVPVG